MSGGAGAQAGGRGGAGRGPAGGRQSVRAGEAFAYFDSVVLPAVYENLDQVFPEFGFVRRGSAWQAAKCESAESPFLVRGDRVFVKRSGGHYPGGFGVAGGGVYSFLGYINGTPEVWPRGEAFFRAAAELARRAGVDDAPLGSGTPVDRDALRLAQQRLERQRAAEDARQKRRSKASIERARALWEEAKPADGAAHPALLRYLDVRGINTAALPARSLGRLGFCMRTPVGTTKATAPAIVAAVTRTTPTGGESVVAVHRIYLGEDGDKHPEHGKKMLGPTRGGCVKLGTPDVDGGGDGGGGTLILCEGIETGLALRAATRLPVWACLSGAGLKSVVLPAPMVEAGTLRRIVIAGDFDDPDLRDERGNTPSRGQHVMLAAAERIAHLFERLHVVAVAPGSYWHLADGDESTDQTQEAAA